MSGLGKLRPEVKAKWVTALRSGRYQQGRSYLRMGDEFCCLGVLCEVAIESGVDIAAEVPDADEGYTTYGGASDYPPVEVAEWAYEQAPERLWQVLHPDSNDPELEIDESLVNLNDDYVLSFAQIADRIEASL